MAQAASAAPVTIAATTVEQRVSAKKDDAEEFADGTMYYGSSDLELIHDSTDQTVGMRWSLAVPHAATITTAYIQFSAKESQTEVTNLTLVAQDADNAPEFSGTSFDITSRLRTSAAVSWPNLPAWTAGEIGPNQKTPDLRNLIQAVVSRGGWVSGNYLAIIVTGTGHRTAYAWDGDSTRAPLLHVEYGVGGEVPPIAALSLTQLASPPLTITADGSGSSDPDATPIQTYLFTFGDGQTLTTTAPTNKTNHTYSTAGTYTVSLKVTDTVGGNSTVSKGITVTAAPPTDNPPVAVLTVTVSSSNPLSVTADGSGSTDTDATPIKNYTFDFGDGTVTTTTASSLAHAYAGSGTYTVKLTVTDTGNLSSSTSKSVTVTGGGSTGGQVAVFAGYYDTHHPGHPKTKPAPWKGSAGVVFVGKSDNSSGGWDASAIKIDNLTSGSLSISVTCDIGSSHYALWGSSSVPAGQSLIVTQTAEGNFDGSDTNPAGCYGCNPTYCTTKVQSTRPVVHVTIGGKTTDYYDANQLLNTKGVDAAGCPYTGTRNDESTPWTRIYPKAALAGDWHQAEAIAQAQSVLAMELPYPNPSDGDLNLRFTIPTEGPVRLDIFDISGRLVANCIDAVFEPGQYYTQANLRPFPNGMYFARLTTPAGKDRKSFILSK